MGRSRDLIAVAAGGAVGALARYGVSLTASALGVASPWATLAVNVVGCLLMGLLAAAVLARPARARDALWRSFLGVGVLGGFTTFSAFAGDAVVLAERGDAVASAVYVVGTLAAGLVALRLGLSIGGHHRSRRSPA